MTDQIVLEGVSARGFHGVLEFEKRDGQTFVVDVTITLDLAPAGRSDDLAATVNYAAVASEVVARITGPSFDLIERLAEVIADDVLAFPHVEAVDVVVHKPQAPVGQPFTDVRVCISRSNAPRAVIALGSNLGDRGQTLALAVDALRALPGFTVTVRVAHRRDGPCRWPGAAALPERGGRRARRPRAGPAPRRAAPDRGGPWKSA